MNTLTLEAGGQIAGSVKFIHRIKAVTFGLIQIQAVGEFVPRNIGKVSLQHSIGSLDPTVVFLVERMLVDPFGTATIPHENRDNLLAF